MRPSSNQVLVFIYHKLLSDAAGRKKKNQWGEPEGALSHIAFQGGIKAKGCSKSWTHGDEILTPKQVFNHHITSHQHDKKGVFLLFPSGWIILMLWFQLLVFNAFLGIHLIFCLFAQRLQEEEAICWEKTREVTDEAVLLYILAEHRSATGCLDTQINIPRGNYFSILGR